MRCIVTTQRGTVRVPARLGARQSHDRRAELARRQDHRHLLQHVITNRLGGQAGIGGLADRRQGPGEEVLEALQYASEGQGLLAGLAILCCALILDRIVQGKDKPNAM